MAQTRDKLSLYASGEGGVDALRGSIPDDLADVYFGFVREEENRKNYYALIAYVPESVSGVRRGEFGDVSCGPPPEGRLMVIPWNSPRSGTFTGSWIYA